jgi:hypothetical protein
MHTRPRSEMRMNTSPKDDSQRDELEHRADVARTKLVVTLGELDRRGHELLDVRKMIGRHSKQLALLAATAALVTIAATVFIVRRRSSRPRRLRTERLEAVQRVWQHPEWLAPKRRSFSAEITRKLALTAIEAVGVRALERVVNSTMGPATSNSFSSNVTGAQV